MSVVRKGDQEPAPRRLPARWSGARRAPRRGVRRRRTGRRCHKLRWIKRQQATFEGQARESAREMVSGESHYFLGRRLRLRVEPTRGHARVKLRRGTLLLAVAPERSADYRLEVIRRWYRSRLRALLSGLMEKWAARLASSCALRSSDPEPHVGSWMVWLAFFALPTPMTLAMMRETSAGV